MTTGRINQVGTFNTSSLLLWSTRDTTEHISMRITAPPQYNHSYNGQSAWPTAPRQLLLQVVSKRPALFAPNAPSTKNWVEKKNTRWPILRIIFYLNLFSDWRSFTRKKLARFTAAPIAHKPASLPDNRSATRLL